MSGRRRLEHTGRIQYRPGRANKVILDPFSHRALCPTCSRDHMNQRQAESCRSSHPPVVPGGAVPLRPSRPDYVPPSATYVPFGPEEKSRVRRLRLSILCVLVGLALVVGAVVAGTALADMSGPSAPGATWVTPTTYGPPGPSGGPR